MLYKRAVACYIYASLIMLIRPFIHHARINSYLLYYTRASDPNYQLAAQFTNWYSNKSNTYLIGWGMVRTTLVVLFQSNLVKILPVKSIF